jgi:hypothetical protein
VIGTVVLLALTASLNPTLVAATTVMLLLPNPKRLMFGYLLGAYVTSLTLGLIIVFALPTSSATKTTQHTLSPVVDIGLGCIAIAGAFVLSGSRGERRAARKRAKKTAHDDKPPRWRRELAKGSARTTFVVGALLTLPGASYLAGLTQIHKLGYSTPATVLLVIGFNVVMLWLLELPLACFAVAPDWTRRTVDQVTAWVGRHIHQVAIWGLTIVGGLLVIKGIVGLIA